MRPSERPQATPIRPAPPAARRRRCATARAATAACTSSNAGLRPEPGRAADAAGVAVTGGDQRRTKLLGDRVALPQGGDGAEEARVVRDAAAEDDDARIDEVDDAGEGAREAVGVEVE